MEIVNLILFVFTLYFSRKNLSFLIFFIFFFIFCYSRYVLSYFFEMFTIGNREWVFPGVTDHSLQVYSFLFFILSSVFLLFSIFTLNDGKSSLKENVEFELNFKKLFYFIGAVAFIFSLYKSYVISSEIIKSGYLSSVDIRFPFWLSIITSSFLKPFLLAIIILFGFKFKRKTLFIVVLFLAIIAFTGQRKDLVSILLFYLIFMLSIDRFDYIKLFLGGGVITLIATAIFWIREDFQNISLELFVHILWGLGFSVNSGLFVVDNYSDYHMLDSLGFLNTYYHCGVGKLFSDVCFTSERLNEAGFLLEKISSHLEFENETIFGGIGGNLIGSLFVASGYGHISTYLSVMIFLLLTILFISYCYFVFVYLPMSVTTALLITQLLISPRYAFDGMFPVLNQLLVALFFDLFLVKKSLSKS